MINSDIVRKTVISGLFLFLLNSLFGNTGNNEGLRNYTTIRTAHIKWEAGLWRSEERRVGKEC